VLTTDQIRGLLKVCEGRDFVSRRDAAIIRLFTDTGMRLSELAGLSLDDLDLDTGTAAVLGKGRRMRAYPFGAKTAQALDRYLRVRERGARSTQALWLSEKGRGSMQSGGIAQMLKRRGLAAGIAGLHPISSDTRPCTHAGSRRRRGRRHAPFRMVIVDYAEPRAPQVAAAVRACSRHGGELPVRMLLLARTAGDWWDRLQATDPHAGELLDGAPVIGLPELEPQPAGQAEAYQQAVTVLAAALRHLPGLQHRDWDTIAGRLAARGADRSGLTSGLSLQCPGRAGREPAGAAASIAATRRPPSERVAKYQYQPSAPTSRSPASGSAAARQG